MKVLERLLGAKTPAEHLDNDAQLSAEIVELEAKLVLLAKRLDDSLFEAGLDVQRNLEDEITSVERQLRRLFRAREATRKRRADAERAEHDRLVEDKMAGVSKLRDSVLEDLKEAHLLATALLSRIRKIRQARNELAELNAYARAEGRGDLVVDLPWQEWGQQIRAARAARRGAEGKAGEGGEVLLATIDTGTIVIPGYSGWHGAPEFWLEDVYPELRALREAGAVALQGRKRAA